MALYGIVTSTAISASTTIHNNTVTLHGGGTTQNVIGIYNVSGATPAANTISIRNNTVTNCTYTTSTKGGFYGIYNTGAPASLLIRQNIISNNSNAGDTSGFFYSIINTGAATVANIDSNSIIGNNADNLTTGLFAGIYNTGAGSKLSINNNTFSGNTYNAVLGVHYGIYQYASVTDSASINANTFGTASSPAITYNVANSGIQYMIYTRSVGTACALSVNNNLFRNVAHTVLGTGTYTFIYNTAIPLYQNINSNVFSNLSINTAASLTLISNNIATPANGVLNVNNNFIIGELTKATGNNIIGYTSSSSASGSAVINHTGNNFSNINAVGTTTITGWLVSNFGSSTVNISGNTFSNWTAVTGAINGMSVSISSVNNNTTGNFINNITSGGAINGITTGGGNDRISNNIINTITSTGATTVNGISMSGGTSKHIFGNKIYDLQSGGATGTVNGISSTGNTSGVIAAQIYNNVIGDLRVPAGNAADPVRGINLNSSRANSSIIISHNTIYLTSSSTGALFGTSGIYQAASSTSTTASLTMRNNIIANLSVTNGVSGRAVAFRRSSASLGNYNVASNNNVYYSGTPSVNRLLYFDGTNSDQTLATFKTRMVTRDAQSVTEDIAQVFLSTIGSSTNFLHLDPTVATQAESGGTAITSITTDIDSHTRQGNSGYAGTGTAPDMGADEFEGIEALPLTGTYTVGTGGNYPSLTNPGGLFAAINSIGLAGDVEVNVISDLTSKTGSYALNQWAEDGVGNYTLTIQSSGGVLRTISGNAAGPLIKLDGADRVTFDGSDGGSFKHLLFKNTNTLGTVGTAFTFINGASENVLRYCAMEAYANATNGVVLFSTSATALGGNSNNLIEYCDINATSGGNTGTVNIYSAGTATAGYLNAGNTIANSNNYNYRERGIDIAAAGNTGWTIIGNHLYNGSVASSITYGTQALHGIRILGGAGYTISNNYIGGSAASAGGAQASYAVASAGLLSYQGKLLTTTAATPASVIKGNVIANIALTSFPTSNSNNGSNVSMGIETNGSGISIGGMVAGEGNRIGSNTANGSISITTNTTFRSNVRGINCQSTGGVVIGNQVGGIDIRNIVNSGTAGPTIFMGILVSAANAPSQVNNNVVGSTGTGAASNSIRVVSTSTCTTTILYGIAIGSTVTSAVQVDGNKVQNFSHLASVTSGSGGGLVGILSSAAGAAVINITNNQVLANNFANYTSAIYYGIYNSGSATTVNMNNNTVADNISSAAAGAYSAILNAGTVTTTININNNSIGNSILNAMTYSVASSGSFTGLNNTGGGTNAALSISNNTIYNINYIAVSTSANNYISNTAATKSQAINGNIFNNINVNTTGTINFIVNNVVVSATGTQNISNNSIAGSYTRKAGGSVLVFNGTATSVAGGVINHSNNNFSNISISGTTPASNITGWTCTDAGGATRTIQNNIFNNWTNGTTGTITVMSINQTNSASAATGNTMNNISGTSTVTGILTAAGNDRIFGNTISNLISSGAAIVSGISITAGTTKNIYRNKIYDLQATAATGSAYGVSVSGTTVVSATIYNNLIGRLYTPNGNSGNDLVRGISVTPTSTTSSINVYYNTIYLDAASATSGANFSTSGVYHTTSTTATTSALNMRNNIIVNVSTPKGTGNTVAYRRSSNALNNYASTSNNNLFYAGTPGTANLIFRDGTNNDQTITAYKTRVANRDSMSQTENLLPDFLSVVGTSPVFLHMDATIPSIIVNGAVPISGITDDYDGQVRYGNPGYTGSGYAPDMGADESFGIEVVPPAISYTPLNDTVATANRELAGVIITDGSGISTTAGTKPRIYCKRFVDANTYVDNTANTNGWKYTEATNNASPFKFIIDYNLLYGGNTGTAGIIQYFVIAQDQATTANVGITSGMFAADPLSVDLTSAAFPITGTINSYKIPFAGSVYVGLGEVYGSFTKADGLFSAINSAGLKGNVDVYVSSDLAEDGANALNQWTEYSGSNYKMTIHPDGNALRIISGNVPNGLIRLNGVDRLKIDGSFSDSLNHLTFRNTNTAVATGSAISFDNGAAADSFVYCNFEAAANTSTGVVKFGAATGVGNSNNYFGYNNINATVSGMAGLTGIYSAGTIGAENANNVFQNNNIYNYQQLGLSIASNSSAWTISGNSFYNGDATGSYNFPAGSTLSGIWIDGGAGYTVSGNYIGGNANHATGTNAVYNSTTGNVSYYGIRLNTTSASPASSIKSNVIARITLTPTPTATSSIGFTGIETVGSGINIGGNGAGEGNLIGANTGNGSLTYTTTTTNNANSSIIRGINVLSSGGSVLGNQIAGVDINNLGSAAASSLFQGVNVDNVTPPASIHGNIIGSFGAGANNNSIRVRAASFGLNTVLQGIAINATVSSAVSIDSNSIQNIAHNSTTSSGSFTGVLNNSSAAVTISKNVVRNLTTGVNTNTSSGIYSAISSNSASAISNNMIENITLSTTGNASQLRGIYVTGNVAHTITANTINNLNAASTKTVDITSASPTQFTVAGIVNEATAAGQQINGNTITALNATNATAIGNTVGGICLTNTSTGNTYNNRVFTLTASGTGTATVPGIAGIVGYNGGYNCYNNVVSLSNGALQNGIRIYGVIDASSAAWYLFYNTVQVGGTAAGTVSRTAAFLRSSAQPITLTNNVLLNMRTGAGNHFAISNIAATPATNWTASNRNNLYSSTASKVGEWGSGTNQTFTQWKASSGMDAASVNRSASFLSSTSDLEPNPVSNCALDNAGIAITNPIAITTDIMGIARSATPDMGAYEFGYVPFDITAGSNTPVCAGSDVDLDVDPEDAINPAYVWLNPLNVQFATTQNPTVPAIAGRYKVTVTDANGCFVTDSATVALNARPTATITGGTTVCEETPITLTLHVTGTGTISGTFNTGDAFSGTAPTINVVVVPSVATDYFIQQMSDANCVSMPVDIADTVTVGVINDAYWTGSVSNAWGTPGNWQCGTVPDSSRNVVIPSGLTIYPVISSGVRAVNDLRINNGASLTVTNASLQIWGNLTKAGTGVITALPHTCLCWGILCRPYHRVCSVQPT